MECMRGMQRNVQKVVPVLKGKHSEIGFFFFFFGGGGDIILDIVGSKHVC